MNKRQHGVTLIELAIALAIIGMMVSSVVSVINLIKNANTNKVMSQAIALTAAVKEFQAKYDYLPGDMANATTYWPTSGNGDGNGVINYTNTTGDGVEALLAWDHLTRANYANFTPSSFATFGYTPGVHGPVAPIEGTAWIFESFTVYQQNHNYITPTRDGPGILKAEDAYFMDKKIDDGLPSTGWVFTITENPAQNPTRCVDGSWAAASVNYQLDDSSISCRLWFVINDY